MDRRQLADFLRTRRSRVTPADVGLSDGTRRRTPGLRREEVARLAGISVDYYTRLEQARGPHPSGQVLGALARALRLSDDERSHLFHLAGQAPTGPTGPSPDVPAGIAMTVALLGDFGARPPHERNLILKLFGAPADSLYAAADREIFADQCVADLRAAAGRYPADPGIQGLIARLHTLSPDFARRWNSHQVAVRRSAVKHLDHPVVGDLELVSDVLEIPDRGRRLILYTAAAGSRSAEGLRLLWRSQASVSRSNVSQVGPANRCATEPRQCRCPGGSRSPFEPLRR